MNKINLNNQNYMNNSHYNFKKIKLKIILYD